MLYAQVPGCRPIQGDTHWQRWTGEEGKAARGAATGIQVSQSGGLLVQHKIARGFTWLTDPWNIFFLPSMLLVFHVVRLSYQCSCPLILSGEETRGLICRAMAAPALPRTDSLPLPRLIAATGDIAGEINAYQKTDICGDLSKILHLFPKIKKHRTTNEYFFLVFPSGLSC